MLNTGKSFWFWTQAYEIGYSFIRKQYSSSEHHSFKKRCIFKDVLLRNCLKKNTFLEFALADVILNLRILFENIEHVFTQSLNVWVSSCCYQHFSLNYIFPKIALVKSTYMVLSVRVLGSAWVNIVMLWTVHLCDVYWCCYTWLSLLSLCKYQTSILCVVLECVKVWMTPTHRWYGYALFRT